MDRREFLAGAMIGLSSLVVRKSTAIEPEVLEPEVVEIENKRPYGNNTEFIWDEVKRVLTLRALYCEFELQYNSDYRIDFAVGSTNAVAQSAGMLDIRLEAHFCSPEHKELLLLMLNAEKIEIVLEYPKPHPKTVLRQCLMIERTSQAMPNQLPKTRCVWNVLQAETFLT